MQLEGEAAKALLMGMASGMKGSVNPLRRSSVICPDCESELCYTERGVIHQNPDRRRVLCTKCGFKGFHYLEGNDVGQ